MTRSCHMINKTDLFDDTSSIGALASDQRATFFNFF